MTNVLERLFEVIYSRKLMKGIDPEKSYVVNLLNNDDDKILRKITEEATEIILAVKDYKEESDKKKIISECADLWFHTLVLLAKFDLKLEDIFEELSRREGTSGLLEKSRRS